MRQTARNRNVCSVHSRAASIMTKILSWKRVRMQHNRIIIDVELSSTMHISVGTSYVLATEIVWVDRWGGVHYFWYRYGPRSRVTRCSPSSSSFGFLSVFVTKFTSSNWFQRHAIEISPASPTPCHQSSLKKSIPPWICHNFKSRWK